MLPVVPELGPDGYTQTAEAQPDTPRTALAILPDGESWVRVNCPPGVAGRIHVRPGYADLFLGLNPVAGTLEYSGLTFGYALSVNGVEAASGQWPPAHWTGRGYVASDQAYIEAVRITYAPEDEIEVTLWAQDGQRFETTWQYQAPRFVQPYPSWTWDGSRWQPPVPYPEDGNDYQWDEPTQSWVPA